jgi:hypothetical protein
MDARVTQLVLRNLCLLALQGKAARTEFATRNARIEVGNAEVGEADLYVKVFPNNQTEPDCYNIKVSLTLTKTA